MEGVAHSLQEAPSKILLGPAQGCRFILTSRWAVSLLCEERTCLLPGSAHCGSSAASRRAEEDTRL